MKIIPMGYFFPYTLSDISVVIPHPASQMERLKWFLNFYIKGTPLEIINNTLIICDQKDNATIEYCQSLGIAAKEVNNVIDWSTYKLSYGISQVKTRLCVRMANDTQIIRSDWSLSLLERFNAQRQPQLIGEWHPSGNIYEDLIQKMVGTFSWYKDIINDLEYSTNENGFKLMSIEYFHAYFMAAQTYIFKSIYPIFMHFNNDKMDAEDILISQMSSLYNIPLTRWTNMGLFVRHMGKTNREFDQQIIIANNTERQELPKPQWKEVTYDKT